VNDAGRELAEIQSTFQSVLAPFCADPRVSRGRMFGASGFKIDGKVFAMLVRDRLVVKVHRARVDALVDAGVAERFDPGHGRLMKEWVAVPADRSGEWRDLVDEAIRFVGGE
jgi:TfoX/Sxy family transcriptional regulator of competence genes